MGSRVPAADEAPGQGVPSRRRPIDDTRFVAEPMSRIRVTRRMFGAVGLALFLSPVMVPAQVTGIVPGVSVPGPAAPRQQVPGAPPRDGAATIPTGTGRIR